LPPLDEQAPGLAIVALLLSGMLLLIRLMDIMN
jgi:hypothetical protein